MLLTIRGIPQLYYGTEILMKNMKVPSDAEVRKDFPGGWPGDAENKFNASGRNEQENKAFEFVKTLAQFRKTSSALKEGKTLQYVPQAGIFTYFRYSPTQTVMVVLNSGDQEAQLSVDRFEQAMKGFSKAKNVMTNETFDLKNFSIGAKSSLVLELIR
jgi:glycosidase